MKDLATGTYSTTFPSFIEPSIDRFYFKIMTEDITKIGHYRLRAEMTVYDTNSSNKV